MSINSQVVNTSGIFCARKYRNKSTYLKTCQKCTNKINQYIPILHNKMQLNFSIAYEQHLKVISNQKRMSEEIPSLTDKNISDISC